MINIIVNKIFIFIVELEEDNCFVSTLVFVLLFSEIKLDERDVELPKPIKTNI
jgi:hypothetical protein